MTTITTNSRKRGSFWGLATGDALGAPLEFYPRDAVPKVVDMIAGGKFKLPAGTWTDDTSMALCLGHSLIYAPNLDSTDVLNRFWDWASNHEYCSQDKAFGFGQNTLRTLMKFYRTGQLKADSTGKRSDGNGSLMRLSPVAIAHHDNIKETRRIARRQSFTTHASEKAADCCELLGMLLCHIFGGYSLPDSLLLIQEQNVVPSWDAEVQDIANQTWIEKNRDEISSRGYVVHTLEAALWCVHHTDSFEDALILAVNLGDDADTVGAVTGQIAGALYGIDAIPRRWLDALANPDMIEVCAEGLIEIQKVQ